MKFGNKPVHVIEKGRQLSLSTTDIQTNPLNPRRLFDDKPMQELKDSIEEHGILVPLTVYMPEGSARYLILDGERRYRCCLELERDGRAPMRIPCNAVQPPDPVANIVYMFAIHKYRLDWELMPTARSLKQLLNAMEERPSDRELRAITGLSQAHIKRCLILMEFPPDLQQLSLDENPKTRVPANFWFEMYGVLELVEQHLPDVVRSYGDKFDIARRFHEKYLRGSIRSVIDFRKVKTAFASAPLPVLPDAVRRLRTAIDDVDASLTELFSDLSSTVKEIASMIESADHLRVQLERLSPELVADVDALREHFEQLYKQLGGYLDELPVSAPPVQQ